MTARYDDPTLPPLFTLTDEDEAYIKKSLANLHEARRTMLVAAVKHVAGVCGDEHPATLEAARMAARAAGGVA